MPSCWFAVWFGIKCKPRFILVGRLNVSLLVQISAAAADDAAAAAAAAAAGAAAADVADVFGNGTEIPSCCLQHGRHFLAVFCCFFPSFLVS